jgi:cell division protease FtsH
MGGRVAEEIVFGQFTTGAGNDIKQASNLARRMVTEFGMSDKHRADRLRRRRGERVPRPRLQQRHATTRRPWPIRSTTRCAVRDRAHEKAQAPALEKRPILDRLAEALLERETLDAEDVDAIVSGRELPARTRVVIPSYSGARAPGGEGEAPRR